MKEAERFVMQGERWLGVFIDRRNVQYFQHRNFKISENYEFFSFQSPTRVWYSDVPPITPSSAE